jgi:hypothetical protein
LTPPPLRLLAIALLAGQALAAGPGGGAPAFEREIRVDAAGRVAVRLDRDVYEGARRDLGDLRVEDEGGREVPYLLDRAGPRGRGDDLRRPALRNRGWRDDGSATVVLDFGERVAKRKLELRLSGDNFRRRVAVEGGPDGGSWTTLVDEAWVFAIPGPRPFRQEAVELPENDFPRLRVVVHRADDERERLVIEDAFVPGDGRPPRLEERLEVRWSEAQEAARRETWIALDLGARHQPLEAVVLDVADERFFREIRVEARRDPGVKAGASSWEEIGHGAIHRLEHDGRRRECLRVEAHGRERWLRLLVRNRDDRPLQVRSVAALVPVERLLFEAATPGRYRLTYGSAERPTPSYDLARTAGDPGAWAETAASGSLGPPRRRVAAAATPPPWTERHPALLWAGLLAVVAALGALTFAALRRAG